MKHLKMFIAPILVLAAGWVGFVGTQQAFAHQTTVSAGASADAPYSLASSADIPPSDNDTSWGG
ncbi:hypothetical protein ADL00_26670 [Streptomyces sp. AS58]|uniref:Uncharacterized protein n=1 Tax=Streptomyces cadmiisoli TaxID=2184053 RepID=A0A2Z4JER2_9ACTN|nr:MULTISPECIES: hypothetical protein [Streptomyces]AWW43481.1 hypothetical protein DN051_43840 [Streptomyces cadmiisoli]KOV57633.1 hypothetical protein ADL00_26670 [Streptomyces sp. AS58]